jgi:hypothetical protein
MLNSTYGQAEHIGNGLTVGRNPRFRPTRSRPRPHFLPSLYSSSIWGEPMSQSVRESCTHNYPSSHPACLPTSIGSCTHPMRRMPTSSAPPRSRSTWRDLGHTSPTVPSVRASLRLCTRADESRAVLDGYMLSPASVAPGAPETDRKPIGGAVVIRAPTLEAVRAIVEADVLWTSHVVCTATL